MFCLFWHTYISMNFHQYYEILIYKFIPFKYCIGKVFYIKICLVEYFIRLYISSCKLICFVTQNFKICHIVQLYSYCIKLSYMYIIPLLGRRRVSLCHLIFSNLTKTMNFSYPLNNENVYFYLNIFLITSLFLHICISIMYT